MPSRDELCGFIFDPKVRDEVALMQAFPCLNDHNADIKGTGKGKEAFLWEIERKLTGKVRDPHNQAIGDCVSHGTSGAAETLLYIQIAQGLSKNFEEIASEAIYGGARHQIGQDRCGYGDGAYVGWAITWGQKYGFLPRRNYTDCDIDLTTYSGQRAKMWGTPKHGCPADLEPVAKLFPITIASLIEKDFYNTAIDVLYNGGVIVSGTNTIFGNVRDPYGFCTPESRGGHCTFYRGYSDNAKRPGVVYQQSWGPTTPRGNATVKLPSNTELNFPGGAFLVDAEEFDKMHDESGSEMWAIYHEEGWTPAPDDFTMHFV